ncbi:GntR family transcriptional regulator [Salinibacterium sp. TMP30]|uniref:GntR family transcriptional regulator n=1 Tax=Salinibacterium sp. TMP30 TaxID=3138237 RepID=UPI00313A00D3
MNESSTRSNNGAAPLWKTISVDLGERLARGEFSHGFPGELELAQTYGVSRGTVRNALRPLRDKGAITAERGRRQRVVESGDGLLFGPLHSLFASVHAAGMIQRSTVLKQIVTTNPRVSALLDRSPTTPLFHLVRIRYANTAPLGWDELWLPNELVEPLAEVDFSNTALYKELRERCGITLDGGREELRADVASALDIHYLACDPGEPILSVNRLGIHAGAPIELRQSRIRGHRYAVTTQFGAITADD